MVTLSGDPLSVTCHCAASPAIGELLLTHAHSRGKGFHVPVVARTITTIRAVNAQFFADPPPEATALTVTRSARDEPQARLVRVDGLWPLRRGSVTMPYGRFAAAATNGMTRYGMSSANAMIVDARTMPS
jgi:hypothetical protein